MAVAMLGKLPLSAVQGLRDDLEERLAGNRGEEWLTALKRFLRKENPWSEASTQTHHLVYAPKDTFRGTNKDGDSYEFLLEVYGDWLQEGRKCLDRPTLGMLDAKLLKALQQKATRSPDEIPPLNEIFPDKVTATQNRFRDGVGG